MSENFLEQAERLSKVSGKDVTFVRTSVYDIDEPYTDAFDVVYLTVGVLGWLPDLPAFFEVVARLLRSSGHLFSLRPAPYPGNVRPDASRDRQLVLSARAVRR